MPSTRRLLRSSGTALGLFVAAFVGGTFAMSETFTAAAQPTDPPAETETATFGNGCFWCTEAVFQRLKGVQAVASGYSGGSVKNPTYEQVCTGTTGHAEALQIIYDPKAISYDDLLAVFWHTHDPTTKDRQGNDVGPQYRSVIFYHNDQQKKLAEENKKKLDASRVFRAPIVTEIVPYDVFYKAENYHQNYYNQHKSQPYCRMVIGPKVEKLKKVFHDKLKTDAPK
jgi:peptide-methionine (S)-S-oxide reductase